MYHEVETIIDYYGAWSIEEVKKLSVRERKHWYNRVLQKVKNR